MKMPIDIYRGLLSWCLLTSREYSVLKTNVIEDAHDKSSVEIHCESVDATLLLDYARRFYCPAVPFIDEALAVEREVKKEISDKN